MAQFSTGNDKVMCRHALVLPIRRLKKLGDGMIRADASGTNHETRAEKTMVAETSPRLNLKVS